MDQDVNREGLREEGTYEQHLGGKIRNENTSHHAIMARVRFPWDICLLPPCSKARAKSILCLIYD